MDVRYNTDINPLLAALFAKLKNGGGAGGTTNYNDLQKGVHATTRFLEMFFGNLLLGTKYELKNRYLHIDYACDTLQSASQESPKGKSCTLEEMAILPNP